MERDGSCCYGGIFCHPWQIPVGPNEKPETRAPNDSQRNGGGAGQYSTRRQPVVLSERHLSPGPPGIVGKGCPERSTLGPLIAERGEVAQPGTIVVDGEGREFQPTGWEARVCRRQTAELCLPRAGVSFAPVSGGFSVCKC